MKLFEALVWNGLVGGDRETYSVLLVEENEKTAKKKAVSKARSENSCFCDEGTKKDNELIMLVREITEVDGFKVTLSKE